MTTRNRNQLPINLEGVKDPIVRDVFENLINFIITLTGTGLETNGYVKASELLIADGGSLKYRLFHGVLGAAGAAGDQIIIPVEGKIQGVTGWTQYNNLDQWTLMDSQGSANRIFFQNSSDSLEDKVKIKNLHSKELRYRAIIFYTDKDI